MDKRVVEFLEKNRVGVLATQLLSGAPHTAVLHYSHTKEPLTLYFSTENTSRKCEALVKGGGVGGSVTIGFSEEEWVTLQMDGIVKIVTNNEELKQVKAIHYPKHPNSKKFENDPATVFLKFTPTWWRYSDFKSKPMDVLVWEEGK